MGLFARVATAVSLAVFFMPPPATAAEVGFGIISTDTPRETKERWAPLLADMEERTGLTIRPVFSKHYEGIIDALRANRVQVAHLGNKAAIDAVDTANSEVFAQANYEGTPGYRSYLIVRADSEIRSVLDILNAPGKYRFGNGDRESTSGSLVPAYYLFAPNRIDPAKYFARMTRNSHGENLAAVLAGTVDVATNNSLCLNSLKKTSPAEADRIRIVWRSPLIPADPMVWRKDFPDAEKAVVRNFFLSYGKKNGSPERQTLATLDGWSSFRASNDDQLSPIRELDLFVTRATIENDGNMPPEEKVARLAEIDAKLAALKNRHH